MATLTENEKKALLILFKDFTKYYNANSLSKEIMISRIGTMKMLKKLEKEELLTRETIGKSITYKVNMENDYAKDLITFLLSDQANRFKRWKDEFKDLFKKDRIIMLYGSALHDYSKARDIDIMIVRKTGEGGDIYKIIRARQKFIPKKIHAIDLTSEELIKNVKQRQEAIIDIVKNAVVLYGQNQYVELIKNVTSI